MSHYLVCSISGKPASEPVVSSKTGRIYERTTLAKHIDMYGTSPSTNEKMTHDDYVSVNGKPLTSKSPFSDGSGPLQEVQPIKYRNYSYSESILKNF